MGGYIVLEMCVCVYIYIYGDCKAIMEPFFSVATHDEDIRP